MKNIIAIIWDFDKTLINGYMQDPIFQDYNVNAHEFWTEVNALPKKYMKEQHVKVNPDTIYLNQFIRYAQSGKFEGLNNAKLKSYGERQNFYAGIPEIFKHTKEMLKNDPVCEEYNIKVEHYIVSTGFAEVIRGTELMNYVENIWGFPAESINDPDNFVSLLFYFGMLTIDGTYRGKTKFVIPNEVVRKQIYAYLLSTYKENELAYDTYQKSDLESGFAYDGDYKSYFGFIADAIKRYSSQRDRQKGESYVHGFTLAMTCQNMFYRPISELDNQAGYADIFLRPLLENYPDMEHSYIVELKYCSSVASDLQYFNSTMYECSISG